MTRRTNAKVAGFAFLIYIAVAWPGMILEGRVTSGEGIAAKLANIAQHASEMRAAIVLELLGCFCALVLAVTLYAITRDQDPDLALLAAAFRVGEGVIGAVSLKTLEGSLWLATAAERPDPATTETLGAHLLGLPATFTIGAMFFAVGSALFAYLLLRGRIVPVALAWLGVLASILTVVCLPLDLVGLLGGPITEVMWFPMLLFEVLLALWLIFKGAAMPQRRQA